MVGVVNLLFGEVKHVRGEERLAVSGKVLLVGVKHAIKPWSELCAVYKREGKKRKKRRCGAVERCFVKMSRLLVVGRRGSTTTNASDRLTT